MNELQLHTLLDSGRQYLEEGKVLHAVQLFRRVLAADPDLVEAMLQLARVYGELGRRDLAADLLRGGHERNPANPVFMLMMGEMCLDAADYVAAEECFRKLSDRRLPLAHFGLGVALFHREQWNEAERELRAAVVLDGRWSQAREVLAELLIRRKDYAGAVRELEQALRVDPYSGAGHRMLGIAAMHRFEFERALEHLVLAVDIDPDDAESWQLCGDILLRMRRFEEAEPYLRKALSLDPRSVDARVNLGYLCLHRGKTRQALAAFNRALQIQPGHPRAVDGKLQITIQRKRVL